MLSLGWFCQKLTDEDDKNAALLGKADFCRVTARKPVGLPKV
jgi:hypothetical protein